MSTTTNIGHDTANFQFTVIPEGGDEKNPALLDYRLDTATKSIDLVHTFTPPSARGQGLAEKLCNAAFDYARDQGLKVIPSCTYISGRYLSKHPERVPQTEQVDTSNLGHEATFEPNVVHHDPGRDRFFIIPPGFSDDDAAFIKYEKRGHQLDLRSTVVPPNARRQGFAGKLADAAFAYAAEQKLQIIPTCSYISDTYLKKNPDKVPLTESQSDTMSDASSDGEGVDNVARASHFYALAADQYAEQLGSDPGNITLLRRAAQLRERRVDELIEENGGVVGEHGDAIEQLRKEARYLFQRAVESAKEQKAQGGDIEDATIDALEQMANAADAASHKRARTK